MDNNYNNVPQQPTPPPAPQYTPPTPPVGYGPQKQNIALCIILSIVTCGIYMYYWLYRMTEDTKLLNNDPNATSGGMVVLLSLVTCGIYLYYWMYKQGESIDAAKNARGVASSNSGILYLILSLVGLSIVSLALMQNEINTMAQY